MIVQAIEINPTSFPAARLTNLNQLLNVLIPLIMLGGAFMFLIMMLRGALQWITAGGNPENLTKAQKTITYAFFGLLIIFVSYLVVKLIGMVLNIQGIL